MGRPTITTLDNKKHEMINPTGRHWRILSEFNEKTPEYTDADFIEKHAAFIAEFYQGVTADDILDLPLEEILPASAAIRNYVTKMLVVRFEKIEKNSETGKEQ